MFFHYIFSIGASNESQGGALCVLQSEKMRSFGLLLQKASTIPVETSTRNFKSLALSVYFKQPDLGMKDYEILCRASAFLLGVDAQPSEEELSKVDGSSGPYAHLEAARQRRERREFQHTHKYSHVSGGENRDFADIGWLEYVPREYRPQVHVVASGHVLAPFLWQDYYPQDWLKRVRAEHCTYALEVYDSQSPGTAPLAKLALNRDVFHHPEGRDIALVHFQEEAPSLRLLRNLGVDVLYLRDKDKLYEKDEQMFFDGYVVSERNPADGDNFETVASSDDENEDNRVFYPYREEGKLSFHTNDRFFATTPEPLPEGLCGAPVLDVDGGLCGTVEGIVPVDHKDKRLAGSAAFMPSHVMKVFIDYVERGLVEQMMPTDLFRSVVEAKSTNSLLGGVFGKQKDGSRTGNDLDETYNRTMEALKKHYKKDELDQILQSVEEQRKEVMEIFDKEGGDLDDIIHRVKEKAENIRDMVQYQMEKKVQEKNRGDDSEANTS